MGEPGRGLGASWTLFVMLAPTFILQKLIEMHKNVQFLYTCYIVAFIFTFIGFYLILNIRVTF